MDKACFRHFAYGSLIVLVASIFSGCNIDKQKVPSSSSSGPQGQSFFAVSDIATTMMNTPVVIQVLNNDSGVLQVVNLSLSISSSPTSGTARINLDNSISYTPASGFIGSDSFQYTLRDGNGTISVATVSVQVTCQNCNNQVTISWQPPQEPNIAGYYLYHGGQSKNYPEKIWVGNVLSYVYPNISSGNHYFSVTTVSANGIESGYSAEVMTTIN